MSTNTILWLDCTSDGYYITFMKIYRELLFQFTMHESANSFWHEFLKFWDSQRLKLIIHVLVSPSESSCFQYLGSCAWSHQSVRSQNGTWKFIFWATLMKHTHRPASEEWHPKVCARVNVRRCTCSVCCCGCLKETGNCHENYQNCLRLTHAHLVSCPLRALASA